MHFISELRYNPAAGCEQKYYRIKESFRDLTGRARNRIMLNVGFMTGFTPEEVGQMGRWLTRRRNAPAAPSLFPKMREEAISEKVVAQASAFWQKMVETGSIDAVDKAIADSEGKARSMVDLNTMEHKEAREMGAEWIALQALRELGVDDFLRREGWEDDRISATIAIVAARAVYGASELRTYNLLMENSAACELAFGREDRLATYRQVYDCAPSLYALKDGLEAHLCRRVDTLFNRQRRILLFDLTNFYFEGRKENSKKAKFGRSKEKRSDCKLLVLALCIDTDGFIRYAKVLEGNTADPASLPDMIEKVICTSPVAGCASERALVVIDAGIATEENLRTIREKGYNYLCVSRSRLTECEPEAEASPVTVHDCVGREITLRQMRHKEGGDYFLMVNSPAKALKESSINRKLRERFEEGMKTITASVAKKGGTKSYEKVIERIGRLRERYPSVSRWYDIEYWPDTDNPKLMGKISCRLKKPDDFGSSDGIYYLRTNVATFDEKTTWDYYNLIREIECTNRQLKTDLSLRPIYHKLDDRADAHIFLGLLAYWVVNLIRLKLKEKGINNYWTEIVRVMSTQKLVTTEAVNALGERVQSRKCTVPTLGAMEIYRALGYRHRIPEKRKICSTQLKIPDSPPNCPTGS